MESIIPFFHFFSLWGRSSFWIFSFQRDISNAQTVCEISCYGTFYSSSCSTFLAAFFSSLCQQCMHVSHVRTITKHHKNRALKELNRSYRKHHPDMVRKRVTASYRQKERERERLPKYWHGFGEKVPAIFALYLIMQALDPAYPKRHWCNDMSLLTEADVWQGSDEVACPCGCEWRNRDSEVEQRERECNSRQRKRKQWKRAVTGEREIWGCKRKGTGKVITVITDCPFEDLCHSLSHWLGG